MLIYSSSKIHCLFLDVQSLGDAYAAPLLHCILLHSSPFHRSSRSFHTHLLISSPSPAEPPLLYLLLSSLFFVSPFILSSLSSSSSPLSSLLSLLSSSFFSLHLSCNQLLLLSLLIPLSHFSPLLILTFLPSLLPSPLSFPSLLSSPLPSLFLSHHKCSSKENTKWVLQETSSI